MNPVIAEVTARIAERSREARAAYLAHIDAAREAGPGRAKLSCANWAHAFAAQPAADKLRVLDPEAPNLAIVSAYNDMLSAHQPLERFPDLIREAAREVVSRVCDDLGESFDEVDITTDDELEDRFGEDIPVTFVDGRQHDFWRVDEARLRAVLGG